MARRKKKKWKPQKIRSHQEELNKKSIRVQALPKGRKVAVYVENRCVMVIDSLTAIHLAGALSAAGVDAKCGELMVERDRVENALDQKQRREGGRRPEFKIVGGACE